jgi:hypothetical protein
MERRRRRPATVRIAVLVAALVALAGAPVTGARPAEVGVPAGTSISPAVWRAVARQQGTLVRTVGRFTVEEVGVPPALRGAHVPDRIFRVRVGGRYAPRALPYVVSADDIAIAIATPASNLRSVVALTADDAVVSGALALSYGDRPATRSPAAALRRRAVARPARLPTPGPFEVGRRRYALGERAFRPTGLGGKVEIEAEVFHPRGLGRGPFPLVLFMHGNHASCFKGQRTSYSWPCRRGWRPLPNHRGYDYAASRLASYGFIVASVSANGVNVLGSRLADTGMRQRGELLEEHLDHWNRWSTLGGEPFGDRFVGRVDMSTIGSMGHSRGGEGVVWHVIVDRERDDPYDIDAVLPLAPVDFTRETVNRVALAVVLPYCDGDVFDLQGVHLYDDARYRVPGDRTPKHTLTLLGANHNFFNRVWTPSSGYPGAFDDARFWPCRGKLTPGQQRRVAGAYIASFFRRHLGGERRLDPVWTGDVVPRGVDPSGSLMVYQAPDRPHRRLDVDRFLDDGSIVRTELGHEVEASGLSLLAWCANTIATPCVPGDLSFADAHLPGGARGVFGWSSPGGEVRFDLGSGVDVRPFDDVRVRVAVNPGYRANEGIAVQDLSLALVDASGNEVSVPASDVGDAALRFPRGVRRLSGHVLLQQLSFPLDRYGDLDLTQIRALVIRFDRTERGVVDVADLAFSAGA